MDTGQQVNKIMDIEQEQLRAHNLVTVYKDWENQKNIIGTALLIKRLSKGLPFILKDTVTIRVPEKKQYHSIEFFEWSDEEQALENTKVYSYEKWLCKIIKSLDEAYPINHEIRANIRYLKGNFTDSEIQSNYKNYDDDDLEEEEYQNQWKMKNLMDTFIEVNKEQIF